MAATRRFGCSLDPDLLLPDLEITDQATTASDWGTDTMEGELEGIKYGSLPLSAAVQAFVQGFAVSAGVHKYMELDMFENMSALKPKH